MKMNKGPFVELYIQLHYITWDFTSNESHMAHKRSDDGSSLRVSD